MMFVLVDTPPPRLLPYPALLCLAYDSSTLPTGITARTTCEIYAILYQHQQYVRFSEFINLHTDLRGHLLTVSTPSFFPRPITSRPGLTLTVVASYRGAYRHAHASKCSRYHRIAPIASLSP
jgi:hypothetical protein